MMKTCNENTIKFFKQLITKIRELDRRAVGVCCVLQNMTNTGITDVTDIVSSADSGSYPFFVDLGGRNVEYILKIELPNHIELQKAIQYERKKRRQARNKR